MLSGPRMSNPSTKPGVAHPVGAIVEDGDITDLEEEQEEESSDESRRSVSHPRRGENRTPVLNSSFPEYRRYHDR